MITTVYDLNGIWIYDIAIGDETVQGVVVMTPNGKADILQIKCRNGMLLCRAFDKDVMEPMDFPVAIFSAVDCEAMLQKSPLSLSSAAVELGASMEMTGAELCLLFNRTTTAS